MFRRTFALMLSGIILSAAFGFQTARAGRVEDARLAGKARNTILKLGVGERSRVVVKLRDDRKLKGYVSAIEADSFTVTDAETGASSTVAYNDVAQVKKSGGLSTMTKVLIGGAVVAGAIIGWQVVKPALCDGGAQQRGPC